MSLTNAFRLDLRRRRRPVPVLRFDAVTGRWQRGDARPRPAPDTLLLTTFNVWFDAFHARRRYQAVADVLAPLDPDVMVFQEVTAPALDVLLAQPWIRDS
jgi:tyrosyl-DNA phosphodiesterase 2